MGEPLARLVACREELETRQWRGDGPAGVARLKLRLQRGGTAVGTPVHVQVGRVVVIGGGIAGLASALSLRGKAREIVIIERDPPPPEISPDQAFEAWPRTGVPQFRHAHVLLARLHVTLREQYPELLDELKEAGIETSRLTELLPETQIDGFTPLPGDEDLQHLWGRRPTFEYILRRYVGRQEHVRFVHDATIVGLLNGPSATPTDEQDAVTITGVQYVREGKRENLSADVVVDASGKRSPCPPWLTTLGIPVQSASHPSRRIYVCRHYKLRDRGAGRPRTGAGANLDYFGFVTFYAEHGHFAITLSCPVEEQAFAQFMSRTEGFEHICAEVPLLRAWTERAVPTTKVLGAGKFQNRWSSFGGPSGERLHGYFPVGDVHIETNPMYGRGCTSAFLQAQALAEALEAATTAGARAQRYYALTRKLLQPHFEFCVSTDRMFQSQGRRARGEAMTRAERALQWTFDHMWTPALESSPVCAREMLRAMQMHPVSPLSVRLTMLQHIIWHGALALLQPRKKPTPLGPERKEALLMVEGAPRLQPAPEGGTTGDRSALQRE